MNTAMHNYTTRGSRKGPADPQLPDQCLLCGTRKVSRCNLRGPKFPKFSTLHTDNPLPHSLCITPPLYFAWPKLQCFTTQLGMM